MSDNQKCVIKGYLFGVVCEELAVLDPAVGARVVAVSARGVAATTAAVSTEARMPDHKAVVRDSNDEEFAEAIRVAVAAGDVDAKGAFCLEGSYDGGLVEVYVQVDRVPFPGHDPAYALLPEPVRFHLGTFEPVRLENEHLLDVVIPNPLWCRLKGRADVWTIAGRVTACGRPNVPIVGVTVSAFDTDIVADDALGSAVTSPAGKFRIDYPGSAFRQGTWVDVELFGGPDVYFKITDSGGAVLPPAEDRSAGRAKGRCDTGPCACFELCVDAGGGSGEIIPSVWTGVGIAFTIPDASGLNDFDAAGYAGAPKYALTGPAVRMTGSAGLRTVGGNPVEYRFLVSDTVAPNGGAALPASAFTRIVGVAPNDGLFGVTILPIAKMVRFSPTFKIVDIDARLVDLDAQGWLDVSRSIQRVFSTRPDLTPADLPDFLFTDADGLMAIDTTKLTSATSPPSADPGVPVAPAARIPVEKVAIRFEVRERTGPGTTVDLPGNGTALNSMVISNTPTYSALAMTEHLLGTPCGILTGSIHAAYTIHHPHLQSVNLHVQSNSGSYDLFLSDPEPPGPTVPPDFQMTMSGNTNAALVHKNNPALAVPNNAAHTLTRCTYLVTLNSVRRVHTGDEHLGLDPLRWTTFFYQP